MDKRFALRLTDEVLVLAVKAAAEQRQMAIGQWVSEAIRQALVPSSGSANCARCEELKERDRQRYRRRRQDAGAPAPIARSVPFRQSGELLQRVCPLCDAAFSVPIKAQHQKYCGKRCTRYAFNYNHDLVKARPAFAAFMLRKQHGSKR